MAKAKIPNHIKDYRILRKLTPTDVVLSLKEREIEISESDLSDYENGVLLPDSDTLFELSDLLKTSIDNLIMPPLKMKLHFNIREKWE